MNGAGFSKGFSFVAYRYGKYHYTDNRQGSPRHFIGLMEQGQCKIVCDEYTVEAGPGETFYIPMGLSYQSYWQGE